MQVWQEKVPQGHQGQVEGEGGRVPCPTVSNGRIPHSTGNIFLEIESEICLGSFKIRFYFIW